MNTAILSFIGLTTTAMKLVHATYPSAVFHGAIGNVPNDGSSTDPRAVTNWTFIFNDGKTANSITLQTEGVWGNFGPLEYHQGAPSGGLTFPWPIQMDIVEAAQLLAGAGYSEPFSSVALRWPLNDPPYTQPFYIFTLLNKQSIGVGVYDKKVISF